MKMAYEQTDNALMVQLSDQPIDYAEQDHNVIIHFSAQQQPVLLEILDAIQFLQQAAHTLPKAVREKLLAAT